MWSTKRVSVRRSYPSAPLLQKSPLSHPRLRIVSWMLFSSAYLPSSRTARTLGEKATSNRKKVNRQTPSTRGIV